MGASGTVIFGTKGETICRPTTWVDVLKFFIFNYALHVLTIVSAPGNRTAPTAIRALTALLLPFSGTFTALDMIHRFARGQTGDLQTAHRAGALCMFLPTRMLNSSAHYVHRDVTSVHGQHRLLQDPSSWAAIVTRARQQWNTLKSSEFELLPILSATRPTTILQRPWKMATELLAIYGQVLDGQLTIREVWDKFVGLAVPVPEPDPVLQQFAAVTEPGSEHPALPEFSLIVVPKSFTVAPLTDPDFTPLTLSCNYSIPKAMVAIIQVLSGSKELYESSERQLPKFGYAAYSLTVIPYLIMSLVNLVATACEPQYPTMFLVLYGGDANPAQTQGVSSSAGEIQNAGAAGVTNDAGASGATNGRAQLVRGAVGTAYGNLREDLSGNRPFNEDGGETVGRFIVICVGGACLVGVTYLVIYLLTGFDGRGSTDLQRGFVMAWLVLGQAYGWGLYALHGKDGMLTEAVRLGMAVSVGVGALGGFVVVAQMMMGDEVCSVI